ncbi:unnamed protein product [Haemonchus placei]|uniref:Uncharacterized protein n=1 Tax=Haemonchus placei TaxID=6290 RepID=A0A0N4WXG3_HAEPC|nr:unnamed protein product [Haemonchus placei]
MNNLHQFEKKWLCPAMTFWFVMVSKSVKVDIVCWKSESDPVRSKRSGNPRLK